MTISKKVEKQLANLNASTKKVHLTNKQLTQIPNQVLCLPQLQELNLDFNSITEVSKAIGNMPQLAYLHLSNNPIESLPEAIGQLSKLTKLDLSNCQLKHLPTSLKHCVNIEYIDLSNNAFETFPRTLLHLTQLKQVYLNNNRIRYIPNDVNRLTNLEKLHLYNNPLTGLPKILLQLKHMQAFTFNSGCFKTFPEVILYLGKLVSPNFAYCFGVDRYLNIKHKDEKYARSIRLSFLRMVHQFDKKNLDTEARKNLFTIFQGQAEKLVQVPPQYFWQALLFQNSLLNDKARSFLTQNYANPPLSKSSEVALIGKCTMMNKTLLKEKLKQNDIKYTAQIKPSSTHILLNRQTVAVYNKAPSQAVFITEQQLMQFLESIAGGYLSNANENNPMTEHLTVLLLSHDETNITLALEMMQGGGFPKSLLTELFVVAKLGPSTAIRKVAMKFLLLQVSGKVQHHIRRRFPLKGKGRLVSKNILYYTQNCPDLNGGKIASYLFKHHSLDLDYFFKHHTVEDQDLFIRENFLFNHQIKINKIRDFYILPKRFYQYTTITHLNLNNNIFRKVPDALNAFPNLTTLDLGSNSLQAVNQNITKAPKLTHLDLSNNNLKSMPILLSKLRHLQWLNLSKNPFSSIKNKWTGFSKKKIVKLRLQKALPKCTIII
ncbi:MAG: leucine-rich repeat domain-containing protein [Chitinophagales bacterium]